LVDSLNQDNKGGIYCQPPAIPLLFAFNRSNYSLAFLTASFCFLSRGLPDSINSVLTPTGSNHLRDSLAIILGSDHGNQP